MLSGTEYRVTPRAAGTQRHILVYESWITYCDCEITDESLREDTEVMTPKDLYEIRSTMCDDCAFLVGPS